MRFDVSKEAAEHNTVLLQETHYDFQHFLETQAGSTLAFGSEFRLIEELQPLLRTFSGFKELAEILVTGMPYRYTQEIAEAERDKEVIAMFS